jgi:hypothetical protein
VDARPIAGFVDCLCEEEGTECCLCNLCSILSDWLNCNCLCRDKGTFDEATVGKRIPGEGLGLEGVNDSGAEHFGLLNEKERGY